MICRRFRLKARPQRTAEVLPIVVRCSPPPLRSGSVGRPTHHADFRDVEFSAGRPPAAPSLDIVSDSAGVVTCGHLFAATGGSYLALDFYPNLCGSHHGLFMQTAILHVEFEFTNRMGDMTSNVLSTVAVSRSEPSGSHIKVLVCSDNRRYTICGYTEGTRIFL